MITGYHRPSKYVEKDKCIPVSGLEIHIHGHHYQIWVCKVDSYISTDVIHISFSLRIIIFKKREKSGKIF